MGKFDSKKSKLSLLLILAIVLQLAGPMIVDLAFADGGSDLGNIFTNPELGVNKDSNDKDENGNLKYTPIDSGDLIGFDSGYKYLLKYKWELAEGQAKEGNKASLQLPDIFKDINISNQPVTIQVVNGEGNMDNITVGSYSINGKNLELIFNEAIGGIGVTDGYIGLGIEIDKNKFSQDVIQKIEFNDKNNTELTVIGKPENTKVDIVKTGKADRTHNPKEISWTIDIANPSGQEIGSATVADIIPDGLKLIEDSIKVQEMTVGSDGGLYPKSEAVPRENEATDGNLSLGFEKIEPYRGYRITFDTKVVKFAEEFTNDASLSYDEVELKDQDTVKGLTRSDIIEKSGLYKGNDIIEWTITVNESGEELSNASVKDELPEELKFVAGSVEIEKYVNDSKVAYEYDKNLVFPLVLGDISSNEYYKIRFETEIDYSKVNEGIYQEENEFTNTAELYEDEELTDTAISKVVTVNRKPVISKSGSDNGYSYENPYLNWTITVNEANHPIDNAVVTDTIPAGLTIDKKNIKVYKGSIDETKLVGDLSIVVGEYDDEKGTEVTISLGEINEKYIIVYKTELTDFSENAFKNSAALGGTGIGSGGEEDDTTVRPPANTYEKKFKGIDYDEKTMDWTITINSQREPIASLKIVDTFPNKGMILLKDTIEVKLGETILKKDIDYTLNPNTIKSETGYNKGFILEFADKYRTEFLNGIITINYKTSFDPQKDVDENFLDPHVNHGEAWNKDLVYINKAEFSGKTKEGHKIEDSKSDKTTIRVEAWDNGIKNGQLVHFEDEEMKQGWISGSERRIAWQLYLNYLKQDLGKGVVVTDTLDYDGEIDESSIKIWKYDVAKDGKITKSDTELGAEGNYTINIEEQKLTITFDDEFSFKERYVVEFITSVPDISLEKYTNEATLKTQDDREYSYDETITFEAYKENLSKGGDFTDNKVYTDTEINWDIKINESLSVVEDAIIVDKISEGLIYVNSSIKLYRLEGTEEIELTEGEGENYKLDIAEDGSEFAITFMGTIDSAHILRYTTVVVATDGSQIGNSVEYNGYSEETVTEEVEEVEVKQFSFAGGTWNPNSATGRIKIEKYRAETDYKIANLTAKFELYYELNGELRRFGDIFETKDGILELKGIPLRTYYLREVEAPSGYEFNPIEGEEGNPPLAKDWPEDMVIKLSGENAESKQKELRIDNSKILTDITVNKDWAGGSALPRPSIELQLFRDSESLGDDYKVTLDGSGDNSWSHTWEGLDKHNDTNGDEYAYTIKETKIGNTSITGEDKTIDNYKPTVIEGNNDNDYTITNTYVIPKTEVSVRKEWKDGSGIPEGASIEVQLYRQLTENGEDKESVKDPVTLNSSIDWSHTWTELEKTDIKGNEYIYTVEEVEVPKNYEAIYETDEEDGTLIVINQYVSPEIEITGTKKWVNGPINKPSIELQLYRDGEALKGEEYKVKLDGSEETPWTHTWKNLDKTDMYGKEYIYKVDEVEVPENYGKSLSEDGLTVTNTYKSPVTDIVARKVWKYAPDIKPTIKLQLYRNGQVLEGEEYLVTLEDGTYEYVWKDMPINDDDGKAYIYSVDELEVPENYEKIISEDGMTITNKYIDPEDPTFKKDIEGNGHMNVDKYDQIFTYNVRMEFPKDISGYESVLIMDQLEDVLMIKSVEAHLDGKRNTELEKYLVIDKNSVYIVLDGEGGFDFRLVAGKTLNMVIKSQIIEGVDMSPYEDNSVPNIATYKLNDSISEVLSEKVTVTPPKTEGELPKTGSNTALFATLYAIGSLMLAAGFILLRKSKQS